MSVHTRVCLVCTRQMAKYTCPRCNVPYCSLGCYKSHDERCTERFAKDNVSAALKNKRASTEEQKKMVNILKRVHENDDDVIVDDDGVNPVSEDIEVGKWLEKMTLGEDADLDLNKLKDETKKAFELACMAGKLREQVESWEPWWKKPVIVPSQSTSGARNPSLSAGPPINEDIPVFSSLFSGKPSPTLPHHLLDIVFAYVSTLLTYNGDWDWDEHGAISMLISFSPVLSTTGTSRHHSYEATLRECIALHNKWHGANEEVSGSLCLPQHCVKVFNGGRLRLLQLLSDLLDLALRAEACLVQSRESKSFPRVERRKIKREINKLCRIQHKMTFFLSWVNSRQETEIHMWAQEVDLAVQMILANDMKKDEPTIFHIGEEAQSRAKPSSFKKKIVVL